MTFRFLGPVLFGVVPAVLILSGCSSSSVGGNEDRTPPTVTLSGISDSADGDGEIVGTATITWTTDEPNRSTVDLYLSHDGGTTFNALANRAPDTGTYTFDSNDVDDCRHCRLRVVARDIVGNESTPADSTADFIINNVPQVLGAAVYYDPNSNGPDDGDTIVVPFDKVLELRTGIASDIFLIPVLADSIGPFATVAKGDQPNELVITMNGLVPFTGHLHVGKTFDPDRLHRTAPSGMNVRDNLSSGILFARDTGRTASFAEGIDIAPGFSKFGNIVGSATTTSLEMGDIDGDGDIDIVEGTNAGPRVWTNDGTGAYTNTAQALGSANVQNLKLGDVDGDGDLDFVVALFNAPNRVFINNGSGVYTDSGQSIGGNDPTLSVALADLDGDGDLDLIEGNTSASSRVHKNNGSGVFSDTGQLLGSTKTRVIVAGDVDGDGDIDFVEGSQFAPTQVWINNGSGTFAVSGQTFQSEYTVAMKLGDIDGDGDLDLVEGRGNGLPVRVWTNNGSGVFADTGQSLGKTYTAALALSDVDGDGDLDLLQAAFGTPSREYLNDGKGVFTDTERDLANAYVGALALGDVDGDYDLDIVFGIFGDNEIWVNSLRTPPRDYIFAQGDAVQDTTLAYAVAFADFDGDGDQDFVEARTGGNKVWLNNGTGGYVDSGQTPGTGSTRSFALGDINGDGNIDIVEADNPNGRATLWLNNGNAAFTDSGQILTKTAAIYVGLSDLDGDGDLDIVFSSYLQPTSVWLNNGSGVFTDSGQSIGSAGFATSLADVDSDKDTDIILSDGTGTTIWLNNGSGVFVDAGLSLAAAGILQSAAGDIDGDGDIDFLIGREENSTLVWLNNGGIQGGTEGQFTLSTAVLGSNYYTDAVTTNSLSLSDFDGDGDLDVLQINSNANHRVWINNGSGQFTAAQQFSSSNGTYGSAVADIDDDGDNDFMLAGQEGTRIWLNDY